MESKVPDYADLVALFQCEPALLDPGVSWVYNRLDFETRRGDLLVRCRFEPGYSGLSVSLLLHGQEVAQVEVQAFHSLEVVMDRGREMLVARFGEAPASTLWLVLKPQVRLSVSGAG